MENNFIQMAASAGHAVAYMVSPIFKHIIDCVELYFTNGFTTIVLWCVSCLWLVGLTLIFDGTPQIIVQRCQIATPRWPNDNNSAADNAIFKIRAQNIKVHIPFYSKVVVFVKNDFSMKSRHSSLLLQSLISANTSITMVAFDYLAKRTE